MPIEDISVDNVTNSPPGGLSAHDYWENRKEFISRMAALLEDVVENKPCRQLRDVLPHP
jgi:hypothetical protein